MTSRGKGFDLGSETRLDYLGLFFFFLSFLFFFLIYFNWRLINLQYCIGFAIHQHESTTGIHMFPILNYPPPRTIPLVHPSYRYHLSKFHIYALVYCIRVFLWLTSLCIIGSSFIHLIRTDSNVFFLMVE